MENFAWIDTLAQWIERYPNAADAFLTVGGWLGSIISAVIGTTWYWRRKLAVAVKVVREEARAEVGAAALPVLDENGETLYIPLATGDERRLTG